MATTTIEQMSNWLEQAWVQLLGIVEPDPEQNFFECGGDSLAAIDLLVQFEERFDLAFPLAELFEVGTLGSIQSALYGLSHGPTQH